jgi:hypothetical protein
VECNLAVSASYLSQIFNGKIKAAPPFCLFAVAGQWVEACRQKGAGAAFPEKTMESTRIAPPASDIKR